MKEKKAAPKKKSVLKHRPWRYAVATALVLLSLLGVSVAFVIRIYFTTEAACYDAQSRQATP